MVTGKIIQIFTDIGAESECADSCECSQYSQPAVADIPSVKLHTFWKFYIDNVPKES